MTGPVVTPAETREMTSVWWLLSLVGLLSVAAGVIILAKPSNSLATLAVVAGIFLLIDGIAELVASVSGRTQGRGLVALLGVLSLILGIMLIRHPIQGVTAVALLIGIWLVAVGAVRFVAAFETDQHRGWNLAVAAVEVIAGIVIVSSPNIGLATLALLAGIAFIMNGIGLVALGWRLHEVRHELDATSHHPGAAAA